MLVLAKLCCTGTKICINGWHDRKAIQFLKSSVINQCISLRARSFVCSFDAVLLLALS